jgi:hypothetical protein
LKVDFNLKYLHNAVQVPIENSNFIAGKNGRRHLFDKKVTIYNDIRSDGVNPRRFDRFVIDECMVYNQATESADGTIQRVVNAQNVITKDVEHYKTPLEYSRLPADEKDNFYTVQVDDFVVLAEVDDIVTTGREFQELQEKYADNGFSVTAVNASIYGMSVDNVQITHA